jgi:hypothetical protein
MFGKPVQISDRRKNMSEFKSLASEEAFPSRRLTHGDILHILKISNERRLSMAAVKPSNQIAFRYRTVDSATGVTRETAKRLAEHLGVDETQAIHRALRELAIKMLPQYETEDGPLLASQVRQIKKRAPQGSKRSVRSSLFDTETA